MHFLLLIPFAFLLFTTQAYAGEPTASDEIPTRIVDRSSCYQGEFGTMEAYLSRPVTAKLYEDPVQRERAEIRYSWWRENIDCEWIVYSVDDLDVSGFIVKPTGEPPAGGWPVIIFNHGGNADIGEMRFQYLAARMFSTVNEGFIVIGSQYRGTTHNGEPNPNRLRDEFGGEDVNDVLALISIIDAIPAANTERIGMWGMSRGGMMAYLAARRTDRIRAMVAMAAPTDQFDSLRRLPSMEEVFATWIPGYEEDREGALKARSAIYWMDELNPEMPILILHGANDQRVNAQQALAAASKLQELGHPYRLVIYRGGTHGLREYHQETTAEVIGWFNLNLAETERRPGGR